jgi:hypothetical protein
MASRVEPETNNVRGAGPGHGPPITLLASFASEPFAVPKYLGDHSGHLTHNRERPLWVDLTRSSAGIRTTGIGAELPMQLRGNSVRSCPKADVAAAQVRGGAKPAITLIATALGAQASSMRGLNPGSSDSSFTFLE